MHSTFLMVGKGQQLQTAREICTRCRTVSSSKFWLGKRWGNGWQLLRFSLSLCSRHSTRETVREQSVVDSLRTRAHLHSEMDARLCDVVLFLTPHPVPELQCAHTPSRNNEQGARFLTTLTPSLRLHAPPANMHSTRHPLLFSKVPFPRIEPTFPWQK